DGDHRPRPAQGDVPRHQRGDAAPLFVRLSALGLRPAVDDLRPAVPERDRQAQRSWRQRDAAVQFEAWRREARARGVTPPAPAPEADTEGLATGTGSVANDPPTAVIHVRYSRTGAVEFLAEVSQSFRLDARKPDHLAPLLAFFRKKLLKLSWSADKNSAAQIGEPGSHLRIDEASIDLLVEHVDDLNGRILGSADGKPGARLVARQELAHGRDVRQRLRP